MSTKEKVRMCPFCEGSIGVDATECKYCGSSLLKGAKSSLYQTQDSLASLYEPPYSPSRKGNTRLGVSVDHFAEDNQEEELENVHLASERVVKTRTPFLEEKSEEEEDSESSHLGALLLLSIGSQLFTLAWLLFFFSDHGKLVLEWKSRYWFIYALCSLPLLYQGWKRLRRI